MNWTVLDCIAYVWHSGPTPQTVIDVHNPLVTADSTAMQESHQHTPGL